MGFKREDKEDPTVENWVLGLPFKTSCLCPLLSSTAWPTRPLSVTASNSVFFWSAPPIPEITPSSFRCPQTNSELHPRVERGYGRHGEKAAQKIA